MEDFALYALRLRAHWHGKSDEELQAAIDEEVRLRDGWQRQIDEMEAKSESMGAAFSSAISGRDLALRRLGWLLVEADRRRYPWAWR